MFSTRVFMLTAALLFSALSHAITTPDKKQFNREQAVALAQQRYPGKIIKVQTEKQHYRIRVVQPDGRVVTVLVDGQSGRVKRDEN